MNGPQSMLVLTVVMVVLMLAGFAKPWLLLWWQDTQTRLGVIKVYGGAAAACYFVYWMLKFIYE